jgi:hypothetical protein
MAVILSHVPVRLGPKDLSRVVTGSEFEIGAPANCDLGRNDIAMLGVGPRHQSARTRRCTEVSPRIANRRLIICSHQHV